MAARSSNKQVFDVAKPGKSAPSPTSRPVIVNHGPVLQDPMVHIKDSEKPDPEPAKSSPTESRKVITPPSESEDKNKPSKDESVNNDAAESKESSAPNKPDDTDDKEKDQEHAQAAAVEAIADQAVQQKEHELTPEEIAAQAEVEKLIEEKKYYVPISHTTRRDRKRIAWLLVALVIVLAAAYAAVDIGFLDLDIKLPYEFIK